MSRYRLHQLEVPLDQKEDVKRFLAKTLFVKEEDLSDLSIERLALDARRRGRPHWSYSVSFQSHKKIQHPRLLLIDSQQQAPESDASLRLPHTIHIVGSGPCGLFAALGLAEKGYQVIVHEQGAPVEERFKQLRHFFKQGLLNPQSNVLFGEGGAGTFSDGKLTCRTRNTWTQQVLRMLVEAGADKDTQYYNKAHVGTDRLQFVVKALRERLVSLGGKILFSSKFQDLEFVQSRINRILINDEWITCEALVLAAGHSARDVYRILARHAVAMIPKPFAIGFRVEHPQEFINNCHLQALVKHTGAAEYVLRAPETEQTKGAYSFCMCPGGVLIPCTTEPNELCTNGMSYSRRSSPFANAGIVVPVELQTALGGLELQEKLEQDAFRIGGGGFRAPAQTLQAFLAGKTDSELPRSSYPLGLVPFDHNHVFASDIIASLKKSLLHFERQMPGFIEKGICVSPETRTSSPIRILRDADTMSAPGFEGLYPLGEGAGYAGGIVSSAADGLHFASLAVSLK